MCARGLLAGLRQDDPSQPVEFRLIVAIAGRDGGLGRSIQCGERVVVLTHPEMGFRDEAQPLAIE